jgi:plasmid stabilization system protein ParE
VNEVQFLPAARAEFLEIAAEYAEAAPTLATDFLAAVERATQRIGTFPNRGSPHLAGTRHVVLRRFPISLVYQNEENGCLVIAVAHHRREPGYWRGRIKRR